MTAAAFVANFVNFGVLFSFGIFLTPIAESFDTSTGPVAPLFSTAVLLLLLGWSDRWKGQRQHWRSASCRNRRSIYDSWLICQQSSFGFVDVVSGLRAIGGSAVGCCYPSMIGTVGRWFQHRRASAISLVLAGVGMGTVYCPNCVSFLDRQLGLEIDTRDLCSIRRSASGFVHFGRSRSACEPAKFRSWLSNNSPFQKFIVLYVALVLGGPGFLVAFYNDHAVSEGISGTATSSGSRNHQRVVSSCPPRH